MTEKMSVQNQTVYVCTGSDCRKHKKAFRELQKDLSEHATVCEVKCQKVCSGPVVGVEVAGQLEWFKKLRESSARRELYQLLRSGVVSKKLKAHVVKARRGKLRLKRKLKKAA